MPRRHPRSPDSFFDPRPGDQDVESIRLNEDGEFEESPLEGDAFVAAREADFLGMPHTNKPLTEKEAMEIIGDEPVNPWEEPPDESTLYADKIDYLELPADVGAALKTHDNLITAITSLRGTVSHNIHHRVVEDWLTGKRSDLPPKTKEALVLAIIKEFGSHEANKTPETETTPVPPISQRITNLELDAGALTMLLQQSDEELEILLSSIVASVRSLHPIQRNIAEEWVAGTRDQLKGKTEEKITRAINTWYEEQRLQETRKKVDQGGQTASEPSQPNETTPATDKSNGSTRTTTPSAAVPTAATWRVPAFLKRFAAVLPLTFLKGDGEPPRPLDTQEIAYNEALRQEARLQDLKLEQAEYNAEMRAIATQRLSLLLSGDKESVREFNALRQQDKKEKYPPHWEEDFLQGFQEAQFYLDQEDIPIRDQPRIDTRSLDWSGIDLSDMPLDSRFYVPGANLSDANFSGAIFSGLYLGGCDLRNATFDEVQLYGDTYMNNADLRGARLVHIQEGAGPYNHGSIIFHGADLTGAYIDTGARDTPEGPWWEHIVRQKGDKPRPFIPLYDAFIDVKGMDTLEGPDGPLWKDIWDRKLKSFEDL